MDGPLLVVRLGPRLLVRDVEIQSSKVFVIKKSRIVVADTLKIMRATMLLSATSNGVGVNVRLVGYGLSISRYQGIYTPLQQQHRCQTNNVKK